MDIIRNKSFGYPVLRDIDNDYTNSTFQIEVYPDPEIDENGNLLWKIMIECSLSNLEIRNLIDSNKAKYIVIVSCSKTFFQDVISSTDNVIESSINAHEVDGTISIAAYILAKEDILNFQASDIHEFYDDVEVNFKKNDIIAIAEHFEFDATRENLADMTSIFRYETSETLSENEWYLDYENDLVTFSINKVTMDKILEYDTANKSLQMGYMVFPALIEVLFNLCTKYENYSEKRWAQAILNKIDMIENLDFENMRENEEYHKYAQTLLGRPISRI